MAQKWTLEEKALLEKNYAELGPKGCAKLLDRPESSVKSLASRAGLKYNKSKWTEDDIELLTQELINGTKYASIGILLNKTESSVMHKVQKLGLSKQGICWKHISDEELLGLVVKYKTAEEFDTNPELPSYKTLVRRFGVNTWNDIKELAGVSLAKRTGRYDFAKPATFYIIQFKDKDGTLFKKYGVTQRSLRVRYRKGSSYVILYEEVCTLQQALDKEVEMSKCTEYYKPIDINFTYKGHGGYTECFIEYINKPDWIDRG
jgi:hypothetical protein